MTKLSCNRKRVNTEQYFEAIKEKIHVRALKVQEGIESTRNANIDQVETDIKVIMIRMIGLFE